MLVRPLLAASLFVVIVIVIVIVVHTYYCCYFYHRSISCRRPQLKIQFGKVHLLFSVGGRWYNNYNGRLGLYISFGRTLNFK